MSALSVKVWICKGEILPTRKGPKRELDSVMPKEEKKKPRRRDDGFNRRNDRGQGGQGDRRNSQRAPRPSSN